MHQTIDWNIVAIDWHGNGSDRGLRGIAFDNDRVYIAASDQLLAYTPEFELIDSWRNPFLKHCHEIAVWERSLFLTSTGYDSILGFDMDECRFNWAMHIETANYRFKAKGFDPMSDDGPMMLNKTGEGLMLVGTGAFLGNLALISQQYNIDFNLAPLLVPVLLSVIAFAYCSQNP